MLRAPLRLTREVLPHMRPGSAIINVTSTFAVVGGLRGGAYSAAKGGFDGPDHPYRLPIRRPGNPVQRGGPRRDLDADGRDAAGRRAVPPDQCRDDSPQRLGTVEDIAATVAFLCSPGGSFINGQTIVVDGGWSSTKYLSEFALTSEWTAR